MSANPLTRAFVGRKDKCILFLFAILCTTFCVVCLGSYYMFGLTGLATCWIAFGLAGYVSRQLESSPFFSEGWKEEFQIFISFMGLGAVALLLHIKLDYLDLALENTKR